MKTRANSSDTGTIKENLLLGVSHEVSDEVLTNVLGKCQLASLVASLPDGINTVVGARGTALSGGQRQRIAIARALLRDTPALLLDEATSALDSESERLIHDALIDGRRSILAIAHRLSTVRGADVIYVMQRGRVVEMGGHDDLMRAKGVYFRMVNLGEA